MKKLFWPLSDRKPDMLDKSLDVIITVHVEEHKKFIGDCHIGHANFFKLLLDRRCPIPLTLLISRVKERPDCPACDRSILREIEAGKKMEIGLHVHPALSRFGYGRQKEIIGYEYERLVDGTGIVPKTFSGGHWCINADTLRVVKELGMLVDASVAPGCVVISSNGSIARFSNKFNSPYWPSLKDINVANSSKRILEMPVSVNYNGRIMDVTTSFLWEMLTSIEVMKGSECNRQFLHLTFHSYDVLCPDGKKNFIYDKIMLLVERLHRYYKRVNLCTCREYYLCKREEDKDEDID